MFGSKGIFPQPVGKVLNISDIVPGMGFGGFHIHGVIALEFP